MKNGILFLACVASCFFSQKMAGQDTIPPVVNCIPGLSIIGLNSPSGVMGQTLILWASDFLSSASDNQTPAFEILFALRDADINPGIGFPIDANGLAQTSLTFDCCQIGSNTLELWAKDKAGNVSFCTTYLSLGDNSGNCDCFGGPPSFACFERPAPFATGPIEGVQVKLLGQGSNGIPDPTIFGFTESGPNGCAPVYATWLPVLTDWNIVPSKNSNPLNGVSTFDLVNLSKHILGVKKFTTGFEYLAADINNNKQVTTFDLVELRKLILGVNTDFPSNTSWRFVEKGFTFNLATNPLSQNFKEYIQIADIMANSQVSFWGVKIGDLNGDALLENATGPIENRTRPTLRLLAADLEMQPGDTRILQFFPEKTGDFLGWQAAFLFDENEIEIDEILPETPDGSAAPVAFRTAPGRLAMNWFSGEPTTFSPDGEAFISLKIRALRKIRLSEALRLEDENLPAEAYSADETAFKIELQFLKNGAENPAAGLSVWPNPFSESVFLKLENAPVGECLLDVFDGAGRLVFSQKMDGATAEIQGKKLGASGSYFFRIADSISVKTGRFQFSAN